MYRLQFISYMCDKIILYRPEFESYELALEKIREIKKTEGSIYWCSVNAEGSEYRNIYFDTLRIVESD